MSSKKSENAKRQKLRVKMRKLMEKLIEDMSSDDEASLSASSLSSEEAGPSQRRSRAKERSPPSKRRRILSTSSSSSSARSVIRTPPLDDPAVAPLQSLNFLGDDPSIKVDTGIPLNDGIVSRWSSYITKGLEGKMRENLMEKWAIPVNCPMLNPPKLNPDLTGMVSATGLKKDGYLGNVQEKLGKGLSALGSILNDLVADEFPQNVKERITPVLVDAAQFFCETHFLLSKHRKFEILPNFNTLVKKVAEESNHDSLLFGSDFPDRFKTAQIAEKSNKEMRVPPKIPFKKNKFSRKDVLQPRQSLNSWRQYYKHKMKNQATYRKPQATQKQPSFRRRH